MRELDHPSASTTARVSSTRELTASFRSIHFSLDEDARWHRNWTAALLHAALRDTPGNREIVQGWLDAWLPLADAAVDALTVILAEAPVPLDMSAVRARVIEDAQSDVTVFLSVPDSTL